MTSHDAVNFVRKIFSTRKVGHGGTLDPAAEGVLPIAVNRATKFLDCLTDGDKTYRAEILFGTATDSGDLEGKIIDRVENFHMPATDELRLAAKNFVGEIEQTPPKFSAIKIDGRKAYDLARKNFEFEIPKRLVKIYRLEVLGTEKNFVTLEVDCSKGTYIRSLAVDIGKNFNLPATLKSLRRIRVGKFLLENSVTLEDLKLGGEKFLQSVESCLSMKKFYLPEHRVRPFLNGLPTDVNLPDATVKIFAGKIFLGTGKIEKGELRSKKLFVTSF